jgi:hypothetical protein
MADIRKILYIGDDGLQARTATGDITNIGGTNHSTFTVDGKGLLFDDGTSTSGSSVASATSLQAAYNGSTDANGNASIKLQTNKDFVIYDDNNNAIFFKIQANTGDVTISGNLTVLGDATIIRSTTEITDHWLLSPISASTIAIAIEPPVGVTPLNDLVNIKNTNAGSPVFRVDATGKTIVKTLQVNGNMTIIGTINGVDIVNLKNEVYDHLSSASFPKHLATQIAISTIPYIPTAVNVQEALAQLANKLSIITLNADVVTGLEFTQTVPDTIWIIPHNQNTKRIQFTVYDELDEWIIPDSFKFTDTNTVEVRFGRSTSGRVVLMLF